MTSISAATYLLPSTSTSVPESFGSNHPSSPLTSLAYYFKPTVNYTPGEAKRPEMTELEGDEDLRSMSRT